MYLYHLTLEISHFKWGYKCTHQGCAQIHLDAIYEACLLEPCFYSPLPLDFNYLSLISAFNLHF